ncbi:hypothetical protein SECTIM467_9 [Brevibacillus phage SecTim467]|uniref:Uncharacterized protein n=2 Tax=Jenstvirus jenst TaxID=1982225 RepID=A0A0K2CPS2_9CAUD|nr:hypothetical protein AVV11_gp009 [Brevibacillus phage Jenst]ALA07139.1 hypothetical protein JENST_9 [Brevibacillus phage Jenst]ALA07594.1 hypothetical protein SECTIM467_9 [Brevibacillus phage SecTim467]
MDINILSSNYLYFLFSTLMWYYKNTSAYNKKDRKMREHLTVCVQETFTSKGRLTYRLKIRHSPQFPGSREVISFYRMSV